MLISRQGTQETGSKGFLFSQNYNLSTGEWGARQTVYDDPDHIDARNSVSGIIGDNIYLFFSRNKYSPSVRASGITDESGYFLVQKYTSFSLVGQTSVDLLVRSTIDCNVHVQLRNTDTEYIGWSGVAHPIMGSLYARLSLPIATPTSVSDNFDPATVVRIIVGVDGAAASTAILFDFDEIRLVNGTTTTVIDDCSAVTGWEGNLGSGYEFSLVSNQWIDTGYIKSTDLTGESWGDYTLFPSPGLNAFSQHGHLVQIDASTYLLPFYGSWQAPFKTGYYKTTDGGDTWAVSWIYSGATQYCESSIEYLGNGKLIVIARNETTYRMGQATSEDSGATWTAMADTNLGIATGVKIPHTSYDSETDSITCIYTDRGDYGLKISTSYVDDVFSTPTGWAASTLIDEGVIYGYASLLKIYSDLYFYIYSFAESESHQYLLSSFYHVPAIKLTKTLPYMAKPWLALYNPTASIIDFYLFSHLPTDISFTRDAAGTVTELSITPGLGEVRHGQITYVGLTTDTNSNLIPDCLEANVTGSVPKYLENYTMSGEYGILSVYSSESVAASTTTSSTYQDIRGSSYANIYIRNATSTNLTVNVYGSPDSAGILKALIGTTTLNATTSTQDEIELDNCPNYLFFDLVNSDSVNAATVDISIQRSVTTDVVGPYADVLTVYSSESVAASTTTSSTGQDVRGASFVIPYVKNATSTDLTVNIYGSYDLAGTIKSLVRSYALNTTTTQAGSPLTNCPNYLFFDLVNGDSSNAATVDVSVQRG